MDFDKFLNKDKLKDVINLISNNKKLSDRLILNTMKENYNSEDYWRYVIEKVCLTNDFIIQNIGHINLTYILKFQKLDNDIITNNKFINNVIDRNFINDLCQYQSLTIQTLETIIHNDLFNNQQYNDKLSNFWNIISRYQILNNDFIRKYDDKLNWSLISTYQNIDLELITDYLDKIDWTNIPLNISSCSLINNNTIKIFDKYPIWENIACLNDLSNDVLFHYFDKLSEKSLINILSYRELNDVFISKIIEHYDHTDIWNAISMNQSLSSEFIDKYVDKLNWNELSENHNFDTNQLMKFNLKIDYKKLSYNDNFNDNWISPLIKNIQSNNNVNNIDIKFLKKYDIIDSDNVDILNNSINLYTKNI